MSLSDKHSELPFIVFPEYNLKVLIDTGSTKSFIHPDIAKELFPKNIRNDPFQISSAHGTSTEQNSMTMPSSKIFNNPAIFMKFHLFKFHDQFQCLLGFDNLKDVLNANIDLSGNHLITPLAKISLKYHQVSHSSNLTINLPPRTEQVIKINVKNVANGEIIISYRKLSCLEIRECLTVVKNREAICTVLNLSEESISFDISNAIEVEHFYDYEFPENSNPPNINTLDFQKYKFDISNIRTNHMNPEEIEAIAKLVKEYSDIFHIEGNYLTFTNKIKHHIQTSEAALPLNPRKCLN
nr:unnamed protein product [Callosobruchus chinensis]